MRDRTRYCERVTLCVRKYTSLRLEIRTSKKKMFKIVYIFPVGRELGSI